MRISPAKRALGALVLTALLAAACGGSDDNGNTTTAAGAGDCPSPDPATPLTLTLAAYSTPREVYGKIIPAFQALWKEDHDDQQVIFQESYGGSTTQSQNVVNGFKADVVALSLAPDVDAIADAGLITHDWTDAPDKGMVSSSVVAFDVRPGNPKGLEDFDDLAQPGVEVLTPDPAQSGGARWNIVGAFGASLEGYAGGKKGDEAAAGELLKGIFSNVTVLDKSARDSIKNFETGNGDVAITYENEIRTAQDAGLEDEMVIPPATVLIENPVAVVDENVDEHCVRDVAEAFVDYLHTQEAKELYTTVGFLRSTDAAEAAKGSDDFPAIKDLFTVDDLGGWDTINDKVFGEPDGIFTKAFAEAQG
ncbi:MAG: sulfate/thiosulfate transport system substrate-binding protein [Actinomycetota bacterium]|nr:sulfate/thiosulfate transport system substrate-binding protein [Actinomycetota bacterium]